MSSEYARTYLPAPIHKERNPGWFYYFIAKQRSQRQLVVQPRMGFGPIDLMRRGLLAVRCSKATTIGTLTLDSYTRVNNYDAARQALHEGHELNGFPLVTHGPDSTCQMLSGILGPDFPVQVRHGSGLPYQIFKALLQAGLDASEGGPVSYCLPYSRTPLRQAVDEWAACCQLMAGERLIGKINHLESFGGCMLGQLCPPSLLVALSILEGIFFRHHGLLSISLSYAQQTNMQQDQEAVLALRRLAHQHLSDVDWHVVIYTYMGVFPRTFTGASTLLCESVRLAITTGSERLIVKTPVEASRIPTIKENILALEMASRSAQAFIYEPSHDQSRSIEQDSEIYSEAATLIDAVLSLSPDPGKALADAFAAGMLDVPYCLHPDNQNLARSYIDDHGCLRWADPGRMPLSGTFSRTRSGSITAYELLDMLSYIERKFDMLTLTQSANVSVLSAL